MSSTPNYMPCPQCHGSGERGGEVCDLCKGSGQVPVGDRDPYEN